MDVISRLPYNYRQCRRCVMDTDTDSEITFDSNGYCQYCREYAEKTSRLIYQREDSEKKLKALTEKIKKIGKRKKYDCLLGVSGGIDSCYMVFFTEKTWIADSYCSHG